MTCFNNKRFQHLSLRYVNNTGNMIKLAVAAASFLWPFWKHHVLYAYISCILVGNTCCMHISCILVGSNTCCTHISCILVGTNTCCTHISFILVGTVASLTYDRRYFAKFMICGDILMPPYFSRYHQYYHGAVIIVDIPRHSISDDVMLVCYGFTSNY